MPKSKYRFNPKTLNYDRIDNSFKRKLTKLLPHIVVSLILTAIIYTVAASFIDTPKESLLKIEVQQLRNKYNELSGKYKEADVLIDELIERDDKIYRTIFEQKPIPKSVREGGVGGVNRYSKLEGYKNSDIVIETTKEADKLLKKVETQSKSYDQILKLLEKKKKYMAHRPAIQPMLIKDLTHIASYYGYRTDPVYGVIKHHDGIDFTAPTGTPVYATGDGTVCLTKYSRRGYGNQVEVDHGFSLKSKYAHLYKIKVRRGQKVKRGDIIGYVGNTGKSLGPHLHYEVRKNNVPVNPINYFILDLTPEKYDKMIEESSKKGGKSLD